jgi:hypothetical protein
VDSSAEAARSVTGWIDLGSVMPELAATVVYYGHGDPHRGMKHRLPHKIGEGIRDVQHTRGGGSGDPDLFWWGNRSEESKMRGRRWARS